MEPSFDRDLVFISYSHKDWTWLEHLRTFLKPYIQQGGLAVWADSSVRVGDKWHEEIRGALTRAAVGVLLVTQDFLASEFITKEELPALLAAAEKGQLKLVCIPIGHSTYQTTRLQEFQWVRDPQRPLESLKKPDRNRALGQIAEHIFALVAEQRRTLGIPPAAVAVVPRERTARRAIPTDRQGALHRVPRLPPHYRPREDDLARLKHSLLGKAAVGITTAADRVGLHGRGGIGKTVLASALARDDDVRASFPDGVYWITFGQQPDLLRLQTELLHKVAGEPTELTRVEDGTQMLEELMMKRSALFVLDDVWDVQHARAFDVLGEQGRLLVTTRDTSVVTALGAKEEAIERLSEFAALGLLASWAGVEPDDLPEAAGRVAAECGCLPLALSAAGARVRDRVYWAEILQALEHGRLEFLDHPHGSVFRSLRLGVDALAEDVRPRYLEFAVFPEAVQVPESIVLRLWSHTGGLDAIAARDLLARFQSRALLNRQTQDDQRFVSLHDLQHDFVRLSVDDLPALHQQLLHALADGLERVEGRGPGWHTLAGDDLYSWLYLGHHLAAADRLDELRALLLDARWLEAKLRRTGMSAVLSDFTMLAHDPDLALVASTLQLSSHVVSAHPEQLGSQLLSRLLATDQPAIRNLLNSVQPEGAWFRPLVASLTDPGDVFPFDGPSYWMKAIAFTPNGRHALSASLDGTLTMHERGSDVEPRALIGHTDWVRAVAVTPDGRHAVSASLDQTLKVWELASATELHTLTGHAACVMAVAITPNGRHAVSGSDDHTLKVWELTRGTELRTFTGHTGGVRAVAITPDGRHAVSASADHTLKVWELATSTDVRTLTGHAAWVMAVAITPDGQHVISASADHTLKVWELGSGTELNTLSGHAGAVWAVAVMPNGRYLVSVSSDWTAKLWDLVTGKTIATFTAERELRNCSIASDGVTVVAGDSQGTMHWLRIEGLAESGTERV